MVRPELAKEWQRKQWVADNRKQECRELLAVIAARDRLGQRFVKPPYTPSR